MRRSLPCSLLLTAITALVFPRIDYCISLLFGIPQCQIQRMQQVLRASARLAFDMHRFTSVSPLLRELKWLPIEARIEYRISVLVLLCRINSAPSYLSSFLCFSSTLPARSRLRSSSKNNLCIPSTKHPTIGGRAFPSSAARVWNALPVELTSEEHIAAFKRRVKLFLRQKHL